MCKVALVSQNVLNLKKSPKETRENSQNFNFPFFGYAGVIKCQENLMISCEWAQFTTAHINSVHGHKTIGSHLKHVLSKQ